MAGMIRKGDTFSRMTASVGAVETNGIKGVAATLQMYMAKLQGPAIQQAMNEIATAVAAMEFERFTNEGKAPLFGIDQAWEPDSDDWYNWKANNGYETGVLRFTNNLMHAAVDPLMVPIGEKGMRVHFRPVVTGESKTDYGLMNHWGSGRSNVPRPWVTITPEFRKLAMKIMEAHILPTANEVQKAVQGTRDKYSYGDRADIPKVNVQKYIRKGRPKVNKQYDASVANMEKNVSTELNATKTAGEIRGGVIGSTKKDFTTEAASLAKAKKILGSASQAHYVRVQRSLESHLISLKGQGDKALQSTELTKRLMSEFTITQHQIDQMLANTAEAAINRSSRAADGFTRP